MQDRSGRRKELRKAISSELHTKTVFSEYCNRSVDYQGYRDREKVYRTVCPYCEDENTPDLELGYYRAECYRTGRCFSHFDIWARARGYSESALNDWDVYSEALRELSDLANVDPANYGVTLTGDSSPKRIQQKRKSNGQTQTENNTPSIQAVRRKVKRDLNQGMKIRRRKNWLYDLLSMWQMPDEAEEFLDKRGLDPGKCSKLGIKGVTREQYYTTIKNFQTVLDQYYEFISGEEANQDEANGNQKNDIKELTGLYHTFVEGSETKPMLLFPYFDLDWGLSTLRIRAVASESGDDVRSISNTLDGLMTGGRPKPYDDLPLQPHLAALPFLFHQATTCAKKTKKPLFVVEGETDALSIWNCNYPAIGIPGAGMWQEGWLREIEPYSDIVIIPDLDSAGASLAEDAIEGIYKAQNPSTSQEARALLSYLRDHLHVAFPKDSETKTGIDVNDLLRSSRLEDAIDIIEAFTRGDRQLHRGEPIDLKRGQRLKKNILSRLREQASPDCSWSQTNDEDSILPYAGIDDVPLDEARKRVRREIRNLFNSEPGSKLCLTASPQTGKSFSAIRELLRYLILDKTPAWQTVIFCAPDHNTVDEKKYELEQLLAIDGKEPNPGELEGLASENLLEILKDDCGEEGFPSQNIMRSLRDLRRRIAKYPTRNSENCEQLETYNHLRALDPQEARSFCRRRGKCPASNRCSYLERREEFRQRQKELTGGLTVIFMTSKMYSILEGVSPERREVPYDKFKIDYESIANGIDKEISMADGDAASRRYKPIVRTKSFETENGTRTEAILQIEEDAIIGDKFIPIDTDDEFEISEEDIDKWLCDFFDLERDASMERVTETALRNNGVQINDDDIDLVISDESPLSSWIKEARVSAEEVKNFVDFEASSLNKEELRRRIDDVFYHKNRKVASELLPVDIRFSIDFDQEKIERLLEEVDTLKAPPPKGAYSTPDTGVLQLLRAHRDKEWQDLLFDKESGKLVLSELSVATPPNAKFLLLDASSDRLTAESILGDEFERKEIRAEIPEKTTIQRVEKNFSKPRGNFSYSSKKMSQFDVFCQSKEFIKDEHLHVTHKLTWPDDENPEVTNQDAVQKRQTLEGMSNTSYLYFGASGTRGSNRFKECDSVTVETFYVSSQAKKRRSRLLATHTSASDEKCREAASWALEQAEVYQACHRIRFLNSDDAKTVTYCSKSSLPLFENRETKVSHSELLKTTFFKGHLSPSSKLESYAIYHALIEEIPKVVGAPLIVAKPTDSVETIRQQSAIPPLWSGLQKVAVGKDASAAYFWRHLRSAFQSKWEGGWGDVLSQNYRLACQSVNIDGHSRYVISEKPLARDDLLERAREHIQDFDVDWKTISHLPGDEDEQRKCLPLQKVHPELAKGLEAMELREDERLTEGKLKSRVAKVVDVHERTVRNWLDRSILSVQEMDELCGCSGGGER